MCLFHYISSFNLDTAVPIVKDGAAGSYFGYSVAQHNRTYSPQTHEHLFLVGAPLDTVNVPEAKPIVRRQEKPGAAYACPMSSQQNDCSYINTEGGGSSNEAEGSNAWLGVSVASQGTPEGHAVVCAHRHKGIGDGYVNGDGLCYTLYNSLDLDNYLDPCYNKPKDKGHGNYGFCQAGSSVDLSQEGDVLIGAPGPFNWRGAIIKNIVAASLDKSSQWYWSPTESLVPGFHEEPDPVPAGFYTYTGLSSKIGSVTTSGKDYVTGAPRSNGTGQVFIFTEDENEEWLQWEPHHVLSGEKFGSYFGHDLAILDLNDDDLQDLVVSAPLFTDNDQPGLGGAIYIYMNQAGGVTSQTKPIRIVCPKSSQEECSSWGCHDARFGYSLAALGDVDQDGFEDLAVGAPFEGDGVLYIYRGGPDGLRPEPSQRIQPSQLILARGLRSFASSLAGGMDMDSNGYPDLVVGAYESGNALVLRSRPVINVITQYEINPTKIDPKVKKCQFSNEEKNCFKLKLYFRFTAKPVETFSDRIALNYKLEAEKFMGRKISRVYFKGSGTNEIEGSVLLNEQSSPSTTNDEHLVYLAGDVNDFLRPIEMRVTYELKDIAPPIMTPGNPLPDINDYPILNEDHEEVPITVHFKKNCKQQDVCQSKLSVMAALNLDKDKDGSYVLTINKVEEIELVITVQNRNGEDAHEAFLHVDISKHLQYIGASRDDKKLSITDNTNKTLSFMVGNPMTPNETARYRIRMEKVDDIPYSVHELEIKVFINTTSTELNEGDNFQTLNVKVVMKADLALTGFSEPSEVQYSGEIIGESAMTKEEDIGTMVKHTYYVENNGHSIPNATLEIDWPYEVASPYTHGKHLLYLIQPPVIASPGKCIYDPYYINPAKLEITQSSVVSREVSEAVLGSGALVPDDEGKTRRRRETIRRKKDVTVLSCGGEHPTAKCVRFTCYTGTIDKDKTREVSIRSYLWNSTFLELYGDSVRHVEILSRGRVTIDPKYAIEQTDDTNDDHEIRTTATPDIEVVGQKGVPLWVIIVAVCGGVLLLILLIFLLWKCGFFKRTKPGDSMPEHKGTLQKKKKGQTAYYEDPYN